MINGIGIDILEISRIKKAMKRPEFLQHVFTDDELLYVISKKKNMYQAACGIFCAKEACLKALGLGIGKLGLKSLEICHGDHGNPYIMLNGNILNAHVSISHCKEYATSVVVLMI